MLAYTVKRILLVVPTLVGILVLVFALMQVVPGDPAAILLGEQATAEAIAEVRHELGLDRSLPVQLGDYIWSSLQGDLGDSFFQNEPVTRAVGARRRRARRNLRASASRLKAVLRTVERDRPGRKAVRAPPAG